MKKIALVVFALAPLLSGCGGANDGKISLPDGKGGTTQITTAGSTSTVTGADGKTTTLSSTATLPDYAPQYPGSTLGQTSTISTGEGSMVTATMSSADPADKILAFYKPRLIAGGLPVAMESTTPEMSMIMAGDGMAGAASGAKVTKGLSAAVTVKTTDGKSEISMVLNAPSK
jgi:hypothetical protein